MSWFLAVALPLTAVPMMMVPAAAQRGGELLPAEQAEADLAGYADCVLEKSRSTSRLPASCVRCPTAPASIRQA